MKNIPPEIFLQIDADGEIPEDFKNLQVTWCVDRIFENDLRYIHEDKAKQITIEFSQWMINNGWLLEEGHNNLFRSYQHDGEHTIQQLYNLFLKDKNKQP